MKVQIEVEIPDGHEIVDVCDVSKHFGGRLAYVVNTMPAKAFLINGVPSDWPEWLTCDWVAKDKNEILFGYDGAPPNLACHAWAVTSYANCGRIFGTAITIPGPFEQSLRENPRRKK